MSLSARITVRASRRLDAVACIVAIGGVVVATLAAAFRWPSIAWPVVAAIAIAPLAMRFVRSGKAVPGYVLSVSDRAEFAVSPDVESGDGESWRLDDSTMMWPGFAVIGLTRGSDALQEGRSMRLALFDAEMAAIDRRSLHRFLLWSIRGGAGGASPRDPGRITRS